jgi:hypothetical protein
MKTDSFSPKKALLIARLIFLSMFAASIVFALIVFSIRTGQYSFRIDSLAPFTLSPLILFCIAIPFGYLYSKKFLKEIRSDDSLKDKFFIYQKILITRLASYEGVALYSVVYLLITGNLFGVLIAAAALSAMWLNFPNVERITSILSLTQSEIEQFQ